MEGTIIEGSMVQGLLTVEQAAGILSVSEKTVHKLVREGKLACVQITPRERRFLPEHLEAFVRARIRGPSKLIDTSSSNRLSWRGKGVKSSGGSSARAQLKKEMREW